MYNLLEERSSTEIAIGLYNKQHQSRRCHGNSRFCARISPVAAWSLL